MGEGAAQGQSGPTSSGPTPRRTARLAGRLAEGYSADLIVLDRNLFEIDPGEIHRTTVRRTHFAGRIVHDAADPVPAAG